MKIHTLSNYGGSGWFCPRPENRLLKISGEALNGVTAHKDLSGDHEGVIERGA
jgi:hypothetical protein